MNPDIIEINEENPLKRCVFCSRSAINTTHWGQMYELDGVVLHYFCMLFSSGLIQEGQDDEGILGFLIKDVKKELKRGCKLKCRFCKAGIATVGCCLKKCKISYHFPCGLENGALFQFMGKYSSYCKVHKESQIIPTTGVEWTCPICLCDVEENPIWPPCCGKSIFHKDCMMQTAKEAGYFFKCPLCNSTDAEFLNAMKSNGIFIPEQDAAWETVPGAFAELEEDYKKCDAETCLCKDGREFRNEAWQLTKCSGCGSSAIHNQCGQLSHNTKIWKCEICIGVLKDDAWLKAATSSDEDDDEDQLFIDESYSKVDGDHSEKDESASSSSSSSEDTIITQLPSISRVVRQVIASAEDEVNEETIHDKEDKNKTTFRINGGSYGDRWKDKGQGKDENQDKSQVVPDKNQGEQGTVAHRIASRTRYPRARRSINNRGKESASANPGETVETNTLDKDQENLRKRAEVRAIFQKSLPMSTINVSALPRIPRKQTPSSSGSSGIKPGPAWCAMSSVLSPPVASTSSFVSSWNARPIQGYSTSAAGRSPGARSSTATSDFGSTPPSSLITNQSSSSEGAGVVGLIEIDGGVEEYQSEEHKLPYKSNHLKNLTLQKFPGVKSDSEDCEVITLDEHVAKKYDRVPKSSVFLSLVRGDEDEVILLDSSGDEGDKDQDNTKKTLGLSKTFGTGNLPKDYWQNNGQQPPKNNLREMYAKVFGKRGAKS